MEKTETQNFSINSDEKRQNILRKIRTTIVDLIVDLARVLFFWIPGGDPEVGRALMTCHPFLIMIFVAMLFLLPSKHNFRILIAIASVAVVASQWLLGGCVITRAEQKLTGSKTTIMDPFLTLAGLPADRNTRIAATIGMGSSISAVLVWATLCDAFIH